MELYRYRTMDIDEINELIENINEAYNEFLLTKNEPESHTISRLFGEFDSYYNGDFIEDLIVKMAIGELAIQLNSIPKTTLEYIKKSLNNYAQIKEEIKKGICDEELNSISIRVNKVLEGLGNMVVEDN